MSGQIQSEPVLNYIDYLRIRLHSELRTFVEVSQLGSTSHAQKLRLRARLRSEHSARSDFRYFSVNSRMSEADMLGIYAADYNNSRRMDMMMLLESRL